MKKRSYYQYRITVNDTQGKIEDSLPPDERWHHIGVVLEDRGGYAKMERRLITDTSILPMLADITGWYTLPNGVVVSPWDIFAEFDYSN